MVKSENTSPSIFRYIHAKIQLEGLQTDSPVRNVNEYLDRLKFWNEEVDNGDPSLHNE